MDLNYIYLYISDILILTKGDRKNHVQKLELTLNKIKKNNSNVILKSNHSEKPKWNI